MSTDFSKLEHHTTRLNEAVKALSKRTFYSPYPEHPKAYPVDLDAEGKTHFGKLLNQDFHELDVDSKTYVGSEISPFWQIGLGIQYPALSNDLLISNAKTASSSLKKISPKNKALLWIEALENISKRFFELGYANMHTSGQSFLMSFQAAGPHANDRALEAIAMSYAELNRFPEEVEWTKPLGKHSLTLKKTYRAVPKGISLAIGCSTFPTWNTVPGVFASLMTGNPVIVKPHPKSILPMAIVVSEIRKTAKAAGVPKDIIQLAPDTPDQPIAKELANLEDVKIIDYTGGNTFGDYIEGLKHKTVFTEKSGINSVILDGVKTLKPVAQNLAFSAALYSGQMCTAPQNIYIPASGISSDNGPVSFDKTVEVIGQSLKDVLNHPKMGGGTLGAIQNQNTINQINEVVEKSNQVLLNDIAVDHPEFADARMSSPRIIVVDATENSDYKHEYFGPIVFIVKTENTDHSITLASELAKTKGAITCLAHTQDPVIEERITEAMNNAFVPVSFNFTGAAFVNQHPAFSDLHVTGGNPSGNATFTNPEFVNRRFVWVGNRYPTE